MTSFYKFVPSRRIAPSFMPMLDGNQYRVTIIWNISAQRYYVKCNDISGNLIFLVPLVVSELNLEIASLTWDLYNTRIIGTTKIPHNLYTGQIVTANIIGAFPPTFNGTGNILILNESQFAYTFTQNPGQYTYGASVGFLISMTKSYFNSTLIYRNGSFEVSP